MTSTDQILRAAGRAIQGDAPFEDFVAMLDDQHRRTLVFALLNIDCGEDENRHLKATDMHYLLGMLGHDHLEVLPIGPHHHLVATCHDGECLTCGAAMCPDHEPMHFHHDGCPATSCDGFPLPG